MRGLEQLLSQPSPATTIANPQSGFGKLCGFGKALGTAKGWLSCLNLRRPANRASPLALERPRSGIDRLDEVLAEDSGTFGCDVFGVDAELTGRHKTSIIGTAALDEILRCDGQSAPAPQPCRTSGSGALDELLSDSALAYKLAPLAVEASDGSGRALETLASKDVDKKRKRGRPAKYGSSELVPKRVAYMRSYMAEYRAKGKTPVKGFQHRSRALVENVRNVLKATRLAAQNKQLAAENVRLKRHRAKRELIWEFVVSEANAVFTRLGN